MNADGVPKTGRIYRQQLYPAPPAICYTPLYGASPVSMAFDLAVASLALQRGELFPLVACAPEDFPGLVTSPQPCRKLTCLRFGLSGEYASISLQRGVA